ncbi:hypothetical protein PV10_04521 [Exophiala mesophila]|uniref:Uncharacterized protein n=1 Tax=Exophiala mesophila TaxID=212818 RepID=A0A0D1XYF9_EXOME|nr:uncharacterized protein PV10_04521 [Exophiala mesophila]KIV93296.1 hypothetical protein PV10_04521 [Exophiala mesophila]
MSSPFQHQYYHTSKSKSLHTTTNQITLPFNQSTKQTQHPSTINMIYSGYYNLKRAQIDAEKSAQSSRRASSASADSHFTPTESKTKKFFKKALEQLKPLPADQIQEPDTFYGPIIRKGPLFVHH